MRTDSSCRSGQTPRSAEPERAGLEPEAPGDAGYKSTIGRRAASRADSRRENPQTCWGLTRGVKSAPSPSQDPLRRVPSQRGPSNL